MRKFYLISIAAVFSAFIAYSQSGYTPLGVAVIDGNVAEVEKLLNSGVNPNEKQDGDATIGLAIRKGNMEIVRLIISSPKFKVDQWYQQTLLGDVSIIKKTAIVDAIKEVQLETVKLLLSKGASVDIKIIWWAPTPGGKFYYPESSPLAEAFRNLPTPDAIEIASLVEAKVTMFNEKFAQNDGQNTFTYLIEDCISAGIPEHNATLERFIKRGFDINYTVPVKEETITMLKKMGATAQVEFTKKYGFKRVVDYAIMANNLDLVAWLLDNGAKLEKADDKGGMTFSLTTNIEMIKLLVERGVNINTTLPGSNISILQLNISSMDPRNFEQLLKMGANPNHKDAMGKSVVDHVSKGGFLPKSVKKNIKLVEKYQKK